MKDLALGSERIAKGAKLNFQLFQSLNIERRDLELLHLISCAVLSGVMQNVRFYDASFLSTKFSEVTFNNCNLQSTDICSIWAKHCFFSHCTFDNATISDSTFIDCTFDSSSFEGVSLTGCQFVNCVFLKFPMDGSTFSLNTFTLCQIQDTSFTESFYYQIFDKCSFSEVNMSPELLGFNFGFSLETVHLLANGADLERLATDFAEKGLYINAAVLRINQVQSYYDEAMIACVAAVGKMIQSDILIKADEISFLKNLTAYFQERKQIAPITILRLWQLLSGYLVNSTQNTATSKAAPHIREYVNALYFYHIDFQKHLEACLERLPQSSDKTETAELQIVYLERPAIPLLSYLSTFSSFEGPNCPQPHLIRTETGSFHTFHEIAVIIIPYLQTLFAFLGVIAPFVIYKKEKRDHEAEKQHSAAEDKKEMKITISGVESNWASISVPAATASDPTVNAVISRVIEALAAQPIQNSTGFSGYHAQNIQSITIRFH